MPASSTPPVVVSFREIHEALSESVMREAPARLERIEATPLQRAAFMASLPEALRAIEVEAAAADPDVLTVPRNRLASLMLSSLAESPPEGSLYEELEPGGVEIKFAKNDVWGWFSSLFEWQKDASKHHPIRRPSSSVPAALPARARVALLSDWGTGLYGAVPCAESIRRDPEDLALTLHLGDVYYSGTETEIQERFLDLWPYREGVLNRALNANHEMYSGGHAYFGTTLPRFAQESSYFAFQNDHWLLVGLDTGYVDHDLDEEQLRWLEAVLAAAGDRKVVLFSHHQLFSRFDDEQGVKLLEKLGGLLGAGRIFAWYWGHEHRCVLYEPSARYGGLRGRCFGHSGMPYARGKVKRLPIDHRQGASTWRRFEARSAIPAGLVLDGPNPYVKGKEKKYGPNGYMTLVFDGGRLFEVVHTPAGEQIYARELT